MENIHGGVSFLVKLAAISLKLNKIALFRSYFSCFYWKEPWNLNIVSILVKCINFCGGTSQLFYIHFADKDLSWLLYKLSICSKWIKYFSNIYYIIFQPEKYIMNPNADKGYHSFWRLERNLLITTLGWTRTTGNEKWMKHGNVLITAKTIFLGLKLYLIWTFSKEYVNNFHKILTWEIRRKLSLKNSFFKDKKVLFKVFELKFTLRTYPTNLIFF